MCGQRRALTQPLTALHTGEQACDNAACFFDGGDCLVEPTLRCPSQSTHFECSGHGHCSSRGSGSDDDEQDDDDGTDPSTDDDGGGTRVFKCECDAGWQGTDCSMRVDACWSTASHPADRATAADRGASSTTPALPCSGYGYCSSGGCQCFPGHTGTTCEIASATCPVGANGQVCSGQGVCRGQDAGAAYCACFTVFSSGAAGACEEGEVDPEWSSCPGYVSTYGVPCNGHGTPIINPTTGQCTCQCEQYYQDDACTPVRPSALSLSPAFGGVAWRVCMTRVDYDSCGVWCACRCPEPRTGALPAFPLVRLVHTPRTIARAVYSTTPVIGASHVGAAVLAALASTVPHLRPQR